METKRRFFAPIVMLSAGAVASIAMFIMQYELRKMLGILLLILMLFYVLGAVFSYVLTRFETQNEAIRLAKEAEEGEVVEKEMAEEGEIETDGDFYAYGDDS
ncbi:MAG: hypothetical protein FWE14_10365 [Lachnospiraceae bacterium]|nr:hypothetical protein [Lachnospiraceae bacterium]